MMEKSIEQKLVAKVKKLGGICPKFISPGYDGMPDRLVLLPKGKIGFVEVKKKGMKPPQLQLARHKLLKGIGFKVFVLDDEKDIDEIVENILGGDAR